MKKFYTFILSLFLSIPIFSQDYTANWEGLFSYYNITDLHSSNNLVFASAKNSVFSYNLSSGEIRTFSTVNGLSGEDISAVHYSISNNLLIVGYETGLINVYNFSTGNTLQVIDITEKETVSPAKRRVNDFYEINNQLLISTNYGISVYNLNNLEFGDTYFIGDGGEQLGVNQIVVKNNMIYAATQGGSVRFAALDNPNLIDFSQWQSSNGQPNIINIVQFADELFVVSIFNGLYRLNNNNLNFVKQLNGAVKNVSSNTDILLVTFNDKIEAYNSQIELDLSLNFFEFNPDFTSGLLVGNQIFIGDREQGLVFISANQLETSYYLSPLGPVLNKVFNMEVIPNELWVTFGEYDGVLNPYPLNRRGVSHLKNEEWVNLSFEELNIRSIGEVTIDPRDPDHVFLSSYIDGLVELEEHEVVNIYNENTSNLQSFNPGSADLRIDGTPGKQ